MTATAASAFALPDRLAAKAAPALIADDERRFVAIAEALDATTADLAERLDGVRRRPAGRGQETLDRDAEVRRLSARLRALRRFGLDLCLGRITPDDGGEPVYVGRLGLTDADGRRLLVDWRSPAAEPFFGATRARPLGLAARRRYRWTGGRVTDYWDEVFTADGPVGAAARAALDDESAFIASLGATRTARMRDVLGTIRADQDAVVRAGSRGTLVVDGGPGTGKTVVALHRAAYLLYADPLVEPRRGGVLVVGPSRPYLDYVADVLPNLGEDGARTCVLRDLVPEGAAAVPENDPEVARLKGTLEMVRAIEPAVRFSERPPTEGLLVETPWADLWLGPDDWAEAFGAPDPGTPHNEARDVIREALLDLLTEKAREEDEEVPADLLRRTLQRDGDLSAALDRAWPVLDAAEVVADLWSVPAYLRLCAPWLTPEQVRLLQRADPRAWTDADLPLLDAARQRLGDPGASRRRHRREAEAAAEREYRSRVADDLIAADHEGEQEGMLDMLRGADLEHALLGDPEDARTETDRLAGPFAHVVVDEAQELTDAQWQMLLRRSPSRSLTVVGDRAQARSGFPESWADRLGRVGLGAPTVASLTINYRTPVEVMAAAEPVIRAALPDANVPTSVRSTGVPVAHGPVADLDGLLTSWLAEHPEGVACVIGADREVPGAPRVRSLSPTGAKGLEFDLVVLVDPGLWGDGVTGAVDRYVAMTRATQRLVVLTGPRG
ncbi:AAA family ATPase [Cellulomonas sp. ACRRI]|uniref:RNA polymerase recycling motor ATPase HelR n=1 Tax=Cellulomonas sp. ACRRI TaxID=2918188 RepID=UPI001EF1A74A|nr:RNA polymerase recycling motor ATPase HelR [Cellulomonas sp. ACRRI]MCG7284415.1 AAA family ATPase [Cellulomonas sp. ACRRI]